MNVLSSYQYDQGDGDDHGDADPSDFHSCTGGNDLDPSHHADDLPRFVTFLDL